MKFFIMLNQDRQRIGGSKDSLKEIRDEAGMMLQKRKATKVFIMESVEALTPVVVSEYVTTPLNYSIPVPEIDHEWDRDFVDGSK